MARRSRPVLLNNAVSHGESTVGLFVAAQCYTGRTSGRGPHIQIGVADGGRGILNHLSQTHPDLTSASDAIRIALQKGESGMTELGRGYGLDEVDTVGRELGGRILLRSGTGLGVITFAGGRSRDTYYEANRGFPGTWVLIDLDLPQSGALGADRTGMLSLKQ